MTGVSYIVFSAEGDILRSGSCPANLIDLQARDGERVAEYPDAFNGIDASHYVTDPAGAWAVVPRQPIGAACDKPSLLADGRDEIVIAPVPMDVTAQLAHPDGFAEMIEHDGSIEFSTELVGSYVLRLRGIAWLDQDITFEALP